MQIFRHLELKLLKQRSICITQDWNFQDTKKRERPQRTWRRSILEEAKRVKYGPKMKLYGISGKDQWRSFYGLYARAPMFEISGKNKVYNNLSKAHK